MKRALLTLLALVIAGCGVDTAVAPRDNVQAVELRTFPKQDWRLANNKFFVWREDMNAGHVSQALAIGKEIDRLDGEALPLNRRHLELDSLISPLKDDIKAINAQLRTVKSDTQKVEKVLADLDAQIKEAQDKLKTEKEKPTPSEDVVKALEGELSVQAAKKVETEGKISDLKAKKTQLDTSLAEKKAELDPLSKELTALEASQLVIEEAGRKQVDDIMKVVEWYKDQPTSVSFQFQKDGTIAASISGWNMGDDLGARNYSTNFAEGRKPTIGNVTYQEVGAIFEFDVYVYTDEEQNNLRETFHFRIGRTKYDYPDGRIFFGGEITRTSADGTIRRGVAKLVDRNN